MASITLLTDQAVSSPVVSPAVQLVGAARYWDSTASLSMPVGTAVDIAIEACAAKNGTYTTADRVHIEIVSPTGKNGADATHPAYTSSIDSRVFGPWYRARVEAVTGTITIITLVVNNHS